ncbi:MAG TPA: 2-oxoglutarate dehydrogenase complex dihydrolipoyllysine-residue succinyltransferase [Tepidisphaeraceae bacterium]|nr:2-oxoglutarate dehydrogenase complex dihydrolipoyllysine-residue succinyltransferase [Tepidisphaeraceae bacterium]
MPTNIEVPSLGESVTEAVLLRWLKNDGDLVATDEPLAELETDKANVDIPAKTAGVLRVAKKPGDTVKVGETIARIDEVPAGAKPAAKPAQPAATAKAAVAPSAPASKPTPAPAVAPVGKQPSAEDLRPSVRRLVEENKVNPAEVTPTGPGGRIIKEDVLRRLDKAEQPGPNGQSPAAPAPVAPGPPPAPVTRAPAKPAAASEAEGEFDSNGVKRVAMSKIRRRIAERLVNAQNTAAILTTFNEVDMSAIMALRAKYKERFNEVYGVSLGFMSFFARAVVQSLREFPRVNAFVDGDDVVYHNYVNLGIAVSTERGLTVPVLQHAETMSFAKIESEIKRLATAARDGKLGLSELTGATFTITNGGVFGSLLSTPILSPPESGILGMHAIKERPVAISGKVEIRPMMYLALSYDHRIVDGRESVSFLVRLKESLEDPTRLMLEI